MQETLTRVWQRLRRGEGAGSLAALVRRTLSGLVVDRRRRARSVDETPEPIEVAGPDERVLSSERRAAVRRAIATLPEPQREVVVLRYYDGLRFRQIAERLDLPLGTVLARMHRAAGRLHGALENEHG